MQREEKAKGRLATSSEIAGLKVIAGALNKQASKYGSLGDKIAARKIEKAVEEAERRKKR